MIDTGFLQGPRPSSLDAGNPLAVDLDDPARTVLFPATHVCQKRTRDRDRLLPFLCFGLSGTPAIHQSGFGFTCLRIQFQINRILQKPKLVNAIAYGLQTEDPAPTAGFVWAIHRISRHFKSCAQNAACLALRYVKPDDWHDTHECLPGSTFDVGVEKGEAANGLSVVGAKKFLQNRSTCNRSMSTRSATIIL